ncbi:glycosyltransferase family 2 protein [Methylobacterium sp. J-076]|uniref:glycosyltransferase family 2 protein n=1 Tax=Methylobacterium sp. J-076 TaxID=2836655 RepID=UPI001FB9D338|nr:glycosyltransferase [Methylobacterium sp. J-076]MCJ2015489.1 glycosyltransferase [Methylobacterium sp. J-076]
MPLLSIVTPTRHAPHLMDRVFDSLLRQTCGEFEHVLVDTSADTRTQERWWRDFAPRLDSRFRYARVPLADPDMAGAFEYALGQARGAYVCPMTHKAMWRADAVDNLHRIIARYPDLPCFAFRSLYVDVDIHADGENAQPLHQYEFGSAWDGSGPTVLKSRDVFAENVRLFGEHGYGGPHVATHLDMPFACHAVYTAELLDRVRGRYGCLVAGRFAGDSRLGYRVMDLLEEVSVFREFEPRTSSMHSRTGAAGSQLSSWPYLCDVFASLSADPKQVISRSPFGYLPLWCVMTYWELFSVVREARGHLRMEIAYPAGQVEAVLTAEIGGLTDIAEPLRAGLLSHVRAIVDRLDGGVLRAWF